MSVFAKLAPRLQEAIVARLGWTSLRPVQELAGEALLAGKNAVILAPTAGGKTEASMFPTLSGLVESPPDGVGALYIAPIKALLNNQAERLGLYTEMVGLRRFVWHGDVTSSERRQFLQDPTELLMTTPESLEVMLVSQTVDAAALFRDLRMVVIDEIHALAGTDRGAHLMSVIERLAALSRHDVQRAGLSATVGNPEAILGWLQGSSQRGGVIVDPPKVPARRELLIVQREDLPALADDAAKMARGRKSLFFCQSRAMTEQVAEHMRRLGTSVYVHHSAVSKEERQIAEERFHSGTDACIVCTSTLELGIDVGDLDRVLQADAPDTVGSFLQRMGRTGRRAGQSANTTFLCEGTEAVLQAIALVELAKAGWVEHVELTDRCWPVLVHQLLALSLAHDGIPAEDAWRHLSTVPDLRGIHRAEFDRLVSWMLRDRALVLASGRLVIGPKVERQFGRRNFMELYAVFSSPASYSVETMSGQPLGTLSQAFVDRLVDGMSCFLLGGRAWVAEQIRHNDRTVRVTPAPAGKKPTWGGFLPQFLGFEVCQAVRAVLASDELYPYLHETALAGLLERRAAFGGVVAPKADGLEVDGDEIRWWTFAGGRINSTLRYGLEAVGGDWKVVPDNFLVKIRGEGLDEREARAAIERLSEVETWQDPKLWEEVAEALPNYRLSKFQTLMPPWVEREMLADYLLDVEGAWRWLSKAEAGQGRRVPGALLRAVQSVPEPVIVDEESLDPPIEPSLPVRWVDTAEGLAAVCAELATEPMIGLDVETTLRTQALCTVQLAGATFIAIVDALALDDLEPLRRVLEDPASQKVLHNARFDVAVLAKHGVSVADIVDTMELSRRARPEERSHSLAAACRRELGIELDKAMQTSDWTRRPLTRRQLAYAALDAEVLPELARVLARDQTSVENLRDSAAGSASLAPHRGAIHARSLHHRNPKGG